MHPCPPRAESAASFQGTVEAVGPEVRHYEDSRQIATARWVALFYCITIHGGTAAIGGLARCTFRTFRSARESRTGWRGRGRGSPAGHTVHHERPEYYSRCTIYIVGALRDSNEPLSCPCCEFSYRD